MPSHRLLLPRFPRHAQIRSAHRLVWGLDKPHREAWFERVLHRLHGRGHPPLSLGSDAAVNGGHRRRGKERAHFGYQATRLDYPHYRSRGFPIVCGIIKGACKTVPKQRESRC